MVVLDFLIRVKNAAMARNKEVAIIGTKNVLSVAMVLKKLGFLDDVKKDKVILTFKNKRPLLMDIKLISKPGVRIYMGVSELEKKKGPWVYIVSTPKGILSSKDAIKERVGGEVIAKVL